MTDDETDAISRYNLDDPHDEDDDLPPRRYWWSLHRPETYAIAALVLAIATVFSLSPAQEFGEALILNINPRNGEKDLLLTLAGVRLGVALVAIFTAMVSVRSEDDDSTWSPAVARAAIVVAVVGALLSVATLIAALNSSDPSTSF